MLERFTLNARPPGISEAKKEPLETRKPPASKQTPAEDPKRGIRRRSQGFRAFSALGSVFFHKVSIVVLATIAKNVINR